MDIMVYHSHIFENLNNYYICLYNIHVHLDLDMRGYVHIDSCPSNMAAHLFFETILCCFVLPAPVLICT